jgi:hypothetical protein
MKKRGQIAVEYLVISAVAISIAVGGWYIVQDSLDEYRDQVQLEKMDTFVRQVIAATEEVVYLGEGAKKSFEADMPEGLQFMRVVKENEIYYLQVNMETTAGIQDLLFELPVELRLSVECSEEDVGGGG